MSPCRWAPPGPVSASTATHVDVGGSYGAGRGGEGPLSQEVNQLLGLWSTAGLPSEELGRMLSGNGSRQLSVGSLLPQLSSLLAEAGLGPGLLPRAASSPVFLESSSPRQASLRLLRGADPGAEERSPFQVVVPGQAGPAPSRHLVPTVPRSGLSQDGSGGNSARDANGTPAPDASLYDSLSNPFERRGSSSQRMSSGGTSGGADGGMGPPPAKRIALARSVSFVPAQDAGLTPTSAVGPGRDPGAATGAPQLTPAAMALLPAVNQLLTELMAVRPASGSPAHSQVNLLHDLLQQLSAGHHR
ncbi:hypothetical protein QBZ16_003827 [Prototheca wickerhamii]|uniref:Uncharacterized protein n=1 Tax=Prototheca wickerhamii TaxID=3111 RepID=A0AAD9IGC8_PROWI|nr:hypothetical protein QBZ16_003827 [Prototheca wickerhamii]